MKLSSSKDYQDQSLNSSTGSTTTLERFAGKTMNKLKSLLGLDIPMQVKLTYPLGTIVTITNSQKEEVQGEVVDYERGKLVVAYEDRGNAFVAKVTPKVLGTEGSHKNYEAPTPKDEEAFTNAHPWSIPSDGISVPKADGNVLTVKVHKVSSSGKYTKGTVTETMKQGRRLLSKGDWHLTEDLERLLYGVHKDPALESIEIDE